MRDLSQDSAFARNRRKLQADHPDPSEPLVGELPQSQYSGSELPDAEELKTGTTTVGLTTADGVVLATDMRASLGGRFVSNRDVQKVEQVHPRAALTMAGSVGGAQS